MVPVNIVLTIAFAFVLIIQHLKVLKNITPIPPLTPQRLFSEAEIAAKSIGYWEKRGLTTNNAKEKMICVQGLMNAQLRLIELTGDHIPDEAKTILSKKASKKQTTSTPPSLPEGVVSIHSARKKPKSP